MSLKEKILQLSIHKTVMNRVISDHTAHI